MSSDWYIAIGLGIAFIIVVGWIILAARKEAERMRGKK